MLGKMLVFCFCLIGVFALLMATLPNDFITASYVYNPSYRDVEIEEEFDANNLVVYDESGGDNMTFPYNSLYDGPAPPDWEAGLPENQFLQVWWGTTTVGMISLDSIRVVHKQRNWILTYPWYSDIDTLTFYYTDGTTVGYNVVALTLTNAWNDDTNSSAFNVKGKQISTSIIFKAHDTNKTIAENWDDGTIDYLLSYEANFTASGLSAFTLIGQLLTFQAPSLGVGGDWGTFLNTIIAIPMWSCIAYIVYKVIAGLIPFVSGGSGD